MNKINLFLDNAALLNSRLDIAPLMYGSLGLQYLAGDEITADDIDILIPEVYISEKWKFFRAFLEAQGYVLTDEHEHTFEKNGASFSYAAIESLKEFSGTDVDDIGIREVCGVRFRLLTPEQYLRVYKASSLDGYRVNVRQKKDGEKIAYIEHLLECGEEINSHGDVYAVYEMLKDRYNVNIDDSKAVNDGYSGHFPLLHGTAQNKEFHFYLYGGLFVLSCENSKGYHDHWHPLSVDEAVASIAELYEK